MTSFILFSARNVLHGEIKMSKKRNLNFGKGEFLQHYGLVSNRLSERRGQNLSIYLRAEHIDKLNRLCRLYKKKPSQLIQDLIDMHYGMIHLVVQEILAKIRKSEINKDVLAEMISEIMKKSSVIAELTEKESNQL